MVQAIKCRRMNMNSSIINGPEVSRLPVAIHILFWLHPQNKNES